MTFPANVDLTGLDGTDGFTFSTVLTGPALGPHFHIGIGETVASAGDLNGDGFADMVIGEGFAGGGDAGRAYVVFGTGSGFGSVVDLTSLDGSNGFRLVNSDGVPLLGYSVASAGDVNGDGFDDLIVGTQSYGSATGRAYVVFGALTGFPATLDLAALDGSNGFAVSGGNFAEVGSSVASAGDINRDGFADIIVGALAASTAYVVYGKASGFSASIDTASLDGSNGGFQLTNPAGGWAGRSVASAGDVNGDGFDDMIVGAPQENSHDGAAYIVFGQAAGFSNVDLTSLDGSNGGFRMGDSSGASAGYSVASAGDVNGDGFDDVIVGAAGLDYQPVAHAFVVFGKASGFGNISNLSGLDGTNGFTLTGVGKLGFFFESGDRTGASVAAAGDLNGDGFDDLIVGAPGPGFGTYSGHSYVLYGKASGFAAGLSVSSIDGSNGFVLTGGASEGSGYSVASAGDVDGDGATDLIIGSWSGTGRVVYGETPADPAVTTLGTSGLDVIKGSQFGDSLLSQGGNDRLYGYGGDDLLSGGIGNDVLAGGTGDDLLSGGDGTDTAYYAAELAGVNVNLATGKASGASTGHDTLGSIENITGSSFRDVLTGGGGANTLTGLAGNDKLNGGAGADTMIGGTGNDSYVVDNAGDVVTELVGEGTDMVNTSRLNYTLGANVENLAFTGTGDFTGTGNELANTITGGATGDLLKGLAGNDKLMGGDGADTVAGGTGNDSLTGGAGTDTFLFDTALGPGNIDTVADFTGGETIALDDAVFAGLTNVLGRLSAAQFSLNAATGTGPQIIYNEASGRLYFDTNGTDHGGSTRFATVAGAPTLSANSFFVV